MDTYKFKTNNCIVNTLRRVIMRQVPNYAFDPKNIKFTRNTSVYNNDILRLRFANLPVIGIINDEDTFNEYLENNYNWVVSLERNIDTEIKKTQNDIDSIYENDITVELLQDNNVLTMYCKVKHNNTKTDILNVTTDMCEFFINEKKIKSPYKSPILLLKLRYDEEIEFSISSRMSIPYESPNYSSVENVFFTEKGDNYEFKIIPRNQYFKSSNILKRAIKIIREMLTVVNELIEDTTDTKGSFEINNDKFTLPSLLVHYLQDHKDVLFAGYHCEHLLGERSIIYYTLKDSTKIKKVMTDIIKSINKDLDKLKIT